MSTEKGPVPGYTRIGVCKECGAGVYAPEAAAREGEFKRMTACACKGGPKAVAADRRREVSPGDENIPGAGKKAA